MFSLVKRFKYYGLDKSVFDSCGDIIYEGNHQSLSVVVVMISAFLWAMTIYHGIVGREMRVPIATAVVATVITVTFYMFGSRMKKFHHMYYYFAVQTLLFYGVYAMAFESYSATVLYPAIVIVLPLFYMHNMYGTVIFYVLNALAVTLMGYFGPESCAYMKPYVSMVFFFTLVGLGIHFVYQSNRLSEFISLQASNEKQKELEISSTFESLTKLLRRRPFMELATDLIKRRKYNDFMCIGVLDIDYFKLINDTYGHQVGDDVISEIGRVVAETLDVSLVTPETKEFRLEQGHDYGNIASRLGGDEFIFLIHSERNRAGAQQLVENLLHRLNETSVGPLDKIRGSIGISVVKTEMKTYEQMYKEADVALYAAKTNGRNQIVFFESEMEMKQANDSKDSLTGLLKAKKFKEQATECLKENQDTKYVIINLDIENFKSYNSAYGFEKGDEFLKKVAKVLNETYPNELISRFADDHFVAMVPLENLEEKVEDIRFRLKNYEEDFKNAIRIGVFRIEDANVDVNIACDHAKLACDTLRGRYDLQMQFFEEDLYKKRDRLQYIAEHIDEAIEKEWIKIYYQPIVSTESGKYCGLEALARWQDPELGFLSPADFIENLERTRLIYKLDLYMVEHICKDYKRCKEEGLPTVPVSVNISRLDFESIDVVESIEKIICEYDVPREVLHIEITESAMVEQEDRLKKIVNQFQQMGFQIWMDDFGSGYSSLNVMKDYQFNVIKLDMAFMRDTSPRARVIITSIVDMAKKLGLQTLAEGVETEEQYEFLKGIGCEFVQGYLFSKPVPLEEFHKKLQEP